MYIRSKREEMNKTQTDADGCEKIIPSSKSFHVRSFQNRTEFFLESFHEQNPMPNP